MKAVVVMFDSLNRHMLEPYGCSETHTPNFARLARHSATFDASYICSMACIPARREFHTGRPNFLHRSWGPIEPYDDSMPEILRKNGVYTHLVTDHYHYFEDGGATYHNRYASWEFFRGQEADQWVGHVAPLDWPEAVGQMQNHSEGHLRHLANRTRMRDEEDMPQAGTFRAGIEFLRENADQDNWMLHIETFDPHEPYHCHRKYKDIYPEEYDGPEFTWPMYGDMRETPEQIQHGRREYKALLSMCDAHLGNVLDVFDELNLWEDTMLVIWTDHGFLLGEHDQWAKAVMPWYEELARTPFFVWDPRTKVAGEHRSALVQPAIDLAPTLLEYFGVSRAPDMLGKSLTPAIANDTPVRTAGMFGLFGAQVNVTDGRHVYMRAPVDGNLPLSEYILMATCHAGMFQLGPLASAEIGEPFSFMKGCRPMRLPVSSTAPWIRRLPDGCKSETGHTRLYDLATDPHQESPINDPAVEQRMTGLLVDLMKECDAPTEQYQRLGLGE